MTDRINTEERYARALASTHLETKPHRSAIDTLTAAGWANEGLGTMLLRLRIEWDYARATGGMASRQFQQQRTAALVALTQHAHRMARRHAARTRFTAVEQIHGIAEQALDHWLDPNCPSCTGRGVHGGAGKMVEVCRECHGSTRKRAWLDSLSFAAALLSEMERKTTRASEKICGAMRD